MKLHRLFFTFLLLLAAFQVCFSQEKPKAVLIDEFGKVSCEEYWARLDNLFNLLHSEPTLTGYIILYGEKNSSLTNLRYERITDGIVRFGNRERSRLVIIRGAEKENIHIQFWKVPAGAENPPFLAGETDLTVKQNKPYILRGYSDGYGVCPANTSVKLFADYLSANPKMRAHIVITDKPTKNFIDSKKDLLSQLVNDHKISPDRLKFFYVKDKTYPFEFADVEYWLIPRKKK